MITMLCSNYTVTDDGKGKVRIHRPREAPAIWCPQKSENWPSNPHGRRPQIRTFGQGLSREFQKRKYFDFFFCSGSFVSFSTRSGNIDRKREW